MQTESLWFSYCRLLGMATLLCGSIATVLDQMLCALRHETTHWIEALVLVFVAAILACVLIKGESLPARLAVIVGGFVASGCLVCLIYCELCVAHWSFTWVLLGLSFCIVLAVVQRTTLHVLLPSIVGNRVPADSSTAKLRLHGHVPDNDSVTSSQELQAVDGHSSAGVISDSELGSEVRSICDEALETANRPTWSRYGVTVVITAVFVIYMVVVPAVGIVIDWWTPETTMSRTLTDMTFAESMRLHTVSGVVMLIFLCAGASIGSFLNVVIYRTPRKLPLLWPPSACPTCHTKLKGKDNIPVLAWLKLGGRCRYCNAAISPRYPIVEVLVAALFVFFYYRELLSGGANLPLRAPNLYHGVVWILLYTKWDLVSIYVFHMLLLVVLLGWGMINLDRFRVPARSAVLTVGAMFVFAASFPHLNPTLSGWQATEFALSRPLSGTVLGCLTGALLGTVLNFVTPNRFAKSGKNALDSKADFQQVVAAAVNDVDSRLFIDEGERLNSDLRSSSHRTELSIDDANHAATALPTDANGVESSDTPPRSNAAASLALVGTALGIESVLSIGTISLVFYLALQLFRLKMLRPRSIPITLIIFFVTVGFLTAWKRGYDLSQDLFSNTRTGLQTSLSMRISAGQ